MIILAALLASACGSAKPQEGRPSRTASDEVRQATNGALPVSEPIRFSDFEPPTEEKYPNAKKLVAEIAQEVTTYGYGTAATDIAREMGLQGREGARLAGTIAPLVDAEMRSGGQVIYPQFSGVTRSSFGAMVVVRQVLEDLEGRRRSDTRVLDIRLRRTDGPWQLDRVASVGGRRRSRPSRLPPAAERVLDHPQITLTDSARWDIYGGAIDDGLLRRLADLADQHEISVSVFSSGHPANVWRTDRRSAHNAGFAVDVYAVAGRLVVRQSAVRSPAYEFARAAVSGGARQVGSPWYLGRGSFTDDVHADHVHIQQDPIPAARG